MPVTGNRETRPEPEAFTLEIATSVCAIYIPPYFLHACVEHDHISVHVWTGPTAIVSGDVAVHFIQRGIGGGMKEKQLVDLRKI